MDGVYVLILVSVVSSLSDSYPLIAFALQRKLIITCYAAIILRKYHTQLLIVFVLYRFPLDCFWLGEHNSFTMLARVGAPLFRVSFDHKL